MRSLLSSPPYWQAYSRAIYCERGFPNLRFDGDFLQATKCAFIQPQQKSRGRQLSSEVPSSVATFRVTIEQPIKADRPTAFFARVIVGRTLVRRPPDRPDLLLRPCLTVWELAHICQVSVMNSFNSKYDWAYELRLG